MIAQSNTIRTNTRCGAGNKIIVNQAFMDILIKTGVIDLPFFNAVQDASFGTLVSMLKYKAAWHNRQIIEIDRFYPSSKICHWLWSQNGLHGIRHL